jgi:hypothetical protein
MLLKLPIPAYAPMREAHRFRPYTKQQIDVRCCYGSSLGQEQVSPIYVHIVLLQSTAGLATDLICQAIDPGVNC